MQSGKNGVVMKLSISLFFRRAFLPIVHHHGYVAPIPEGHRFPMQKFHHVFRILMADSVISSRKGQVFTPELPSWAALECIHESVYLSKLQFLRLSDNETRRIGLPQTAEVVQRCRLETGGTLLAAKLAFQCGLAVSTAGGTHHAFPSYGSGFCMLNDLAVAAKWCINAGLSNRVLIVDLDVHQGDGTAFTFENDNQIFTFSMHCEQNFPMRKQKSDIDVSVQEKVDGGGYLSLLCDHLPWIMDTFHPELVLYDAGVDVHKDDILGKLSLTDDDIYIRDSYVINAALKRGIPCACVIGGGYSKDIIALAKRHTILHRAALRSWENI